ncbi:hypothetical protein ACSBR1_040840 [Camellia fascicularis]
MRRSSSPSLQFLAAAAYSSSSAAAAATMSSRRPYRPTWRRDFSDRPSAGGGGRGQFVTGDSHFQSVSDANRGFRPVEGPNFAIRPQSRPHFNPRRHFNPPPPFNPSPTFNHPPPHFSYPPPPPPPFQQNQPFRRPQQFRPQSPKPLDYRNWEFAKPMPPPRCERFTVLSYNILADYLAINHRSKLYFHIPRHMLEWEWRKRNIIFELGLWSADILCFQEVDRFQELEEELKRRGYSGIWKMRTGDPVDGCAIFWRISRFKLLHEECIEFNKLGLRDNVAQICVLESLNKNDNKDMPLRLTGSNKVVICNIHVLFNPKRGEIKLGQIRVLLDRAHAVSKLWDDAPVVLCGDFNCTPKSPLYNYISEQKLNISDLPRDKLSGQASAEIRPPRQFNPNFRAQSADSTGGASAVVDHRELGQKQDNTESNSVNLTSMNIISQPQCVNTGLNVNSASPCEITKETDKEVDGCKDETHSTVSVPNGGLKESRSSQNNGGFCIEQTKDGHEQSQPNLQTENESMNCDKSKLPFIGTNDSTDAIIDLTPSGASNLDDISSSELFLETSFPSTLEVPTVGGSENLSSLSVADDKDFPSTLSKVNASFESTSVSLNEDETNEEDESFGEDSTDFLSELHGKNCSFPSDFSHAVRSVFVESDKSFDESTAVPHSRQLHYSRDEVLDDNSPGMESEPVQASNLTYDLSAWTPMEIETATGKADCTLVEHPLKLRSTYAEVEDGSGTRDSNGEPLVTSYHRCFLGTVDYIWHTEGLQTVRVLAPIPKNAMQWTPGFPTRKWGSDHIALVSELAFMKDPSIQQNTEAP